MRKRKMLRSRCSNSTCRRQFRHADPSAKTCSPACKQSVYRARRKEAAEREAERQEFERTVKYKQMLLEVRRREAERQAAERQAADDDRPDEPPSDAGAARPRRPVSCVHGACGICVRCLTRRSGEPEPRKIEINMRPHYRTASLNQRY